MFYLSADIVNTFVTVFVNLYIWEKGKNVVNLALFDFCNFFFWMFSYTFGTWILHKKSMKNVFRLSYMFTFIMFIILAFAQIKNLVIWIILIGSSAGFMNGFSSAWKTFGVAAFGDKKEFTQYFQFQTLLSRTFQIVTPLIFAFLLTSFGYKNSFFVMCFYSVILISFTHFLPDNENKSSEPLFKNFTSPFKTSSMKLIPLSFIFGGIFAEFQTIFLTVLTFSLTQSKYGVAFLNIAYTLLIIGLIMLNKKMKNIRGVTWLFFGVILSFLGFGIMMYFHNWLLFVANFLTVTGNFYFSTHYFSQHYDIVNDLNEIDKKRLFIWRENLLACSRIFLLFFIIIIGNVNKSNIQYIFWFVMVIAFLIPVIHKYLFKWKISAK